MSQALELKSKAEPAKGLDLYLQGIRKVPLLSREEERHLAQKWFDTRDREAGQKLVLSNLRFVVKVAHEYKRYGFRLADLIQEGNLGLLHALDKYDPRKGYRLISYSVWWIRAYIQSYILRSWSMVRMGTTRAARRILGGLQIARRKISSMNGGGPANNLQLAKALEVSPEELSETLHRMSARDQSMEAPVNHEGDMVFGDTLADEAPNPESEAISRDLSEKVRGKLDEVYESLSPRERFLLNRRLLSDSPISLEAVGAEFKVTRERVRQIEERLKGKLRGYLAPAVGQTAFSDASLA